jgi:hypothetical protein
LPVRRYALRAKFTPNCSLNLCTKGSASPSRCRGQMQNAVSDHEVGLSTRDSIFRNNGHCAYMSCPARSREEMCVRRKVIMFANLSLCTLVSAAYAQTPTAPATGCWARWWGFCIEDKFNISVVVSMGLFALGYAISRYFIWFDQKKAQSNFYESLLVEIKLISEALSKPIINANMSPGIHPGGQFGTPAIPGRSLNRIPINYCRSPSTC